MPRHSQPFPGDSVGLFGIVGGCMFFPLDEVRLATSSAPPPAPLPPLLFPPHYVVPRPHVHRAERIISRPERPVGQYRARQEARNVVGQYLRRWAERGGLSWEHQQGIALRSPLSPVLGAFFLTEVDDALERLGLCAVRSMDDMLVLAPTRWKLRQAVKVVHQGLTSLRLAKHPVHHLMDCSPLGTDAFQRFEDDRSTEHGGLASSLLKE